jgi:tetratricopeptide (TPR) repeat protein
MYYKSIDERDNQNRSDVIKKIFLSIPINDDEVQVLIKMINKNSLSFFIYMLGSYPNKKQLIVILQSILKQFPNILEAQKLLAKILDEHGRVDDAVRVMERIIEVDQSDVTIFFYLISYYLKQGQESKIKPVIEKIEKNFSHLPDVMSRVRTLRRKLLTFTTVPL